MFRIFGCGCPLVLIGVVIFSACSCEEISGDPIAEVGALPLNDASRDPEASGELKPWPRLDLLKDPEFEVEWYNAPKHIGHWVAATGTVVRAYDSGRATFLNFAEDWEGKFHGVIFARSYPDYPDLPIQLFEGKRVRITGKVGEHRGAPQIVIDRPEQIEVLK